MTRFYSATAAAPPIPATRSAMISATSGTGNSARQRPDVGRLPLVGAQEAFTGDALPADMSHAMGNTIATSNMVFATYNPVNMASVRKVHDARKAAAKPREGGEPPAGRSAGRLRGNGMRPKVGADGPEKSAHQLPQAR